MKRKLVVCALAACMVMLLATSALAAGVMPLWDKVDRCTPSLTINGNTASCKLDVIAYNNNDKITATVILQKENSRGNYTNVKSWPGLKGTGYLYFADSYTVTAGSNYRLRADVTVSGSSGTESITEYAY